MADPSPFVNPKYPSVGSISGKSNASVDSIKEVPENTAITSGVEEEGANQIEKHDAVEEAIFKVVSGHESSKPSDGRSESIAVRDEPIKEEDEGTVVLAETTDRRVSLVGPAPPTTPRKSSVVHARKSYYVPSSQRLSIKPSESTNQDIALLNRYILFLIFSFRSCCKLGM